MYVLLLTLISLLPTFYLFNTSVINGIEDLQETLKNDLPSFVIENGELVSDETAPITINKSDLTVIFDSTGTITSDDAKTSSVEAEPGMQAIECRPKSRVPRRSAVCQCEGS